MVLIMRKSGGPPFSQVKAANDIRRVIKIRIVQKGFSQMSHIHPYFKENNDIAKPQRAET